MKSLVTLLSSLYYVAFALCILLCIYQAQNCIMRFLSNPMTSEKKLRNTASLPPIGFTVLGTFRSAYKKHVLDRYGINIDNYRGGNADWVGNSSMTPEQVYDEVTYNISELVEKVIINVYDGNDSNLEFNVADLAWEEKSRYHLGKGFELVFPEDIVKRGLTRVSFYIRDISIYILLRHIGQMIHWDEKSSLETKPGEILSTDLIHSYNDVLEINKVQCDPGMNEKYDHCFYRGLAKNYSQGLGCRVPFLPQWALSEYPNLKACTDHHQAKLAWTILRDWHTGKARVCPEPCRSLQVNIGAVTHALEFTNQKSGSMTVLLKQNIWVTTTRRSYIFLNMLAEIGGYMGLLLGVSILQAVQHTKNVCQSACTMN